MALKNFKSPLVMRRRILDWYDCYRRVLPWRALAGQNPDPYHVWLSEIMLQQTTVATVGPYFISFCERWPTVEHLAAADLDEILHGWQGLGYYARARNMHLCAKIVSAELNGCFPENEGELRKLPGIGNYTAAAISAIAFGKSANVVDGNVERVMARFYAIEEPLPRCKSILRALSADITPKTTHGRPGDFAQAVMDLGATICTPRNPKCSICPWQPGCAAFEASIQKELPYKKKKAKKPIRRGVVFWVIHNDGSILLRKRPDKGLLAGMVEVPSTDWLDKEWTSANAKKAAPLKAGWTKLPGRVRHTFTHFHLELWVLKARVGNKENPNNGIWVMPDSLGEYALPTVMKKIIDLGLKVV